MNTHGSTITKIHEYSRIVVRSWFSTSSATISSWFTYTAKPHNTSIKHRSSIYIHKHIYTTQIQIKHTHPQTHTHSPNTYTAYTYTEPKHKRKQKNTSQLWTLHITTLPDRSNGEHRIKNRSRSVSVSNKPNWIDWGVFYIVLDPFDDLLYTWSSRWEKRI